MKKFKYALGNCIVFLVLATFPVFASEDGKFTEESNDDAFYIGGLFGISKLNDADGEIKANATTSINHNETKYNLGFLTGLSIGYSANNFSLEGEAIVGRSSGETESKSWSKTTEKEKRRLLYLAGMLNGHYNFATSCSINPYLSVGAGIGRLNIKANNKDGLNANAFATQFKIGAKVDTGSSFVPYIGYRILHLMNTSFTFKEDDKSDNSFSQSHTINSLETGVIFKF